ncbi:MAG: DUF790 family protein [Myxococcales bacterium]|nr:DUF790 family protein [Myxococcales bacterium]
MLTADLVQVRKRKGQIEVRQLSAGQEQSLVRVAQQLIDVCQSQVGEPRGKLLAIWDATTRQTQYPKLVKGLRKLVLDRCTFEDTSDIDPRVVRKTVFRAAAAQRLASAEREEFQAAEALAQASEDLKMETAAIEKALFSDLKENHVLIAFDFLGAESLVALYERSQQQAVLLRAVKVKIMLHSCSPSEYRLFFQRLKFRRLLHTITALESGGYEINIDGPFSLFQAVTKYGLQLAMMLPVLEECRGWQLEAEIAWGKLKERYQFQISGKQSDALGATAPWVPEDVERLRLQMSEAAPEWQVQTSDDLLNLPGIGICVPDLSFTHKERGLKVYLEVMGYWSRDAVWKRVELVEAGLPDRVIFAVGRRLRVSEEVLDDKLPSQIYVYKGVMSPKVIRERLESMLE